ncbi:hypothetical protein DMNBHIDG_02180 [Candidatus Methanoperedenaceae archaeon GB37]|nr:hypothetical protein DMNBHIDG_02180 [Candidatus Methanoperedenaceae archaeon GB37]
MIKEIEIYIKKALKALPKFLRHDAIVAETIKCALFQWVWENKLIPVPNYKPPHRSEEPLALVALNNKGEIVYGFAVAPVVTLSGVKTLKAIEAKTKYFHHFFVSKEKSRRE